MKKIKIILLSVVLVLFVSCDKEDETPMPPESEFVSNFDVKFVFLNENNEDLIDTSNIQSYPVTFKDNYSEISADDTVRGYENALYFNGNMNSLTYHAEIGKYVWETGVYGFDNVSEYKTYVHFEDNSVDTILVKYSFSTECICRYYCAQVTKAYYNSTLIYPRESDTTGLVYVTKTANQTTVEFK